MTDQTAITTTMTYEQFEQDWMKRHRGSAVKRVRVSSWGLIFGLLLWGIIAIGAALVSGAHSVPAIFATIPALVPSPFRELLSLSGFSIFELLIFAGSMYRRDSRYAGWGLLISVAGALAANIGSSIHAVTENGGDLLSFIVALVLAFIAPLAAFLAGEMVHHLYERHAKMIEAANAVTDQKRRELDATINREYSKYLKTFDGGRPVHSLNSVNTMDEQLPIHSVNSVNSANGYTKQMNSRAIINGFFERHPDFKNMTLDQLNEAIEREDGVKVGRTSIHNVRKEWQQALQNNSSNGHAVEEASE